MGAEARTLEPSYAALPAIPAGNWTGHGTAGVEPAPLQNACTVGYGFPCNPQCQLPASIH